MLDAVKQDGPCFSDVEKALHAQDILASGVKQHTEPDPEGRPVYRAVEGQRGRMRPGYVASVSVLRPRVFGGKLAHVCAVARSERRPVGREEEIDGIHLPEGGLDDAGGGVGTAEPAA